MEEFMTKQQLEKTLKELQYRYYILEMQDHWDANDYRFANVLKDKINELEEKIKK